MTRLATTETMEREAELPVADTAALVAMLSYRRPAGSKTEKKFINRFLRPLGRDVDMRQDKAGNVIVKIGDAPRLMFSSHTDSVHRSGGTQRITCAKNRYLKLAKSEKESNCLGADCAAGVWLMREMILANKPGLYIFHRGEEIGGVGSSWLADNAPDVVAGVDFCIALDRRNRFSVITHQAGGRCCSDAFADSLCTALDMGMRKDSGGLFTDSANYTDLIGECTNVSVGFDSEHWKTESLDTHHLLNLRDKLIALDPADLVLKRKPGEREPRMYSAWNSYGFGTESDSLLREYYSRMQEPEGADLRDEYETIGRSGKVIDLTEKQTLSDLVFEFPDEVADILEQYGVDSKELVDMIRDRGGDA